MLGLKISGLNIGISDDLLNQLDGSVKAGVDALTVAIFEADVLAFAWTDLDGFSSHLVLFGFDRRDELGEHLFFVAVGLLDLHLGHGLVVSLG